MKSSKDTSRQHHTPRGHWTRRRFLQAAAASTAVGLFNIGPARAQRSGKVVVLGFDGVEPTIVEEMMAQGQLPAFARLQEQGAFRRLRSTIPPQSPVAWTSFATCKNPGGHNIFDFIRRDPKGPRGPVPQVGTGEMNHVELGPDGAVRTQPSAIAYRTADPFWSVGDGQGVTSTILNVPFAYPPDPLKNGRMLCGLGVPDLRGTTSTFLDLSDAFTSDELQERLSGGQRLRLTFDRNGAAQVPVPGPRDERHGFRDPKAFTEATLQLKVDRGAGAGTASFNGQSAELAVGQWSEWVPVEFKMSPQFTVRALTRFFPVELGDTVRVYMSCMQFHPEDPYMPISQPDEYSADLMERFGPYKTIGWAYDTHAFRQGALAEEAFLEDVRAGMRFREQLTMDALERGDNLLLSVWTATDRVGHMFWRFRDEQHPLYNPELAERFGKALEESYQIADRITGRVLDKLSDDDLFMVLSDHGFASWRTGFNLNDWLEQEGYLSLANRQMAERGFLLGIDWSQTQAYCIGLSSLYLNIQGRESEGSVAPDRAAALRAELRDKLLTVKDPANGAAIFSNVYMREDFSGDAVDNAPDLSLGYAQYYQSSKTAAKGAVGNGLTETNADKWSGEHAASDVAELPGILFCNQAIEKDDPDIRDLGVTALRYLGRDVPGDFEGDNLV